MERLPLFPLNTVLFPGMLLPLHIFEPRYRVMIERCIKNNDPFGVVLIREGQEVGGQAVPHEIGTTAHITQVERLDDGRMNVQAIGYRRFKILELHEDKPYLSASIEIIPLAMPDQDNDAIHLMLPGIQQDLKIYMKSLEEITGNKFSLNEIPDDGLAVAYLAAIVMPVPTYEKQQLLSKKTLLDLLLAEQRLLKRERLLLDLLQQSAPKPVSDEMPFSYN